MDRNKEQRDRLQADITSTNGTISFYERQQRDLTEKIFAARAAVVLAQAAYERANGIAEELLAGAALATAKTVLEDLLRDQQRCQNGLRDARDRLSRLQRDLDNLGR
jgi:precorrin-6B methylase 1